MVLLTDEHLCARLIARRVQFRFKGINDRDFGGNNGYQRLLRIFQCDSSVLLLVFVLPFVGLWIFFVPFVGSEVFLLPMQWPPLQRDLWYGERTFRRTGVMNEIITLL